MKKLISIFTVVALMPFGAYAVSVITDPISPSLNCCSDVPCQATSYDSSCTSTFTCQCSGVAGLDIINKYGVISHTSQKSEHYCVGTVGYARCVDGTTTYTCGSGYYGTAKSETTGCTACPSNAACDGGNGSTFVCDAGYYKNGTVCTQCATATGHNSATSAAGSTAITDCYLPTLTSFSDSTGSGRYRGACYYTK